MKLSPAAELLVEAAELLYGEHWPNPLGNDINVNPRTLRAIKEGRFELPKDHPMIAETLELLRDRQREITQFITRLQRKTTSAAAAPRPSRPAALR